MSKILTKILLIAGVAMLALAALTPWYAPILGWALYASGRAGACTYRASVDSVGTFNEQHRSFSELRSASRRLATDEAAGVQLWSTPAGDYWAPKTASFDELFNDLAEQKRGIYSADGSGAKSGDVVLDCGANIGLYTKTALAAGAAKVIAIEPVPANLECIRRNLAKEIEQGKVVVVAKGVWHQEDWLEMAISDTNGAGHSFIAGRIKADRKLRLPLTTIDRLTDELGLGRVDYIKMDIEGAERNALDGAQETLKRFHPRMALSVYHLSDDPVVIPARVRSGWAGYRQTSGPCEPGEGRLQPQVYFYY